MNEASVRGQMQGVIDLVKSDIATIRTGRATPDLVNDVRIPAYGGAQMLRIMELGSITSPDSETIIIDPWDKSVIGDIRKGLLSAQLGLNPQIDGEVIRLSFPPLTREDREKYVKLLNGRLEQGRIMIRRIRADVMRDIKNSFDKKDISEDVKFQSEKHLQDLTDEFVGHIEEIGKIKESELLGS